MFLFAARSAERYLVLSHQMLNRRTRWSVGVAHVHIHARARTYVRNSATSVLTSFCGGSTNGMSAKESHRTRWQPSHAAIGPLTRSRAWLSS